MDLKCLQTSYIVYFTSWMGQWNILSTTKLHVNHTSCKQIMLLTVNKMSIFLKATVTHQPEVVTLLSKALFTGECPALLSALF